MKAAALAFVGQYQEDLAELEIRAALAEWKAANTGKEEDFEASADATLALKKYHSDAEAYQRLEKLMAARDELRPVQDRALELALLAYRRNQLPADLLEKMVDLSTEIRRQFNTYRAELDGEKRSNNESPMRSGGCGWRHEPQRNATRSSTTTIPPRTLPTVSDSSATTSNSPSRSLPIS